MFQLLIHSLACDLNVLTVKSFFAVAELKGTESLSLFPVFEASLTKKRLQLKKDCHSRMHTGAMQICLFFCKQHIFFQPRIAHVREVIITLEVKTVHRLQCETLLCVGNLILVILVMVLCSHQITIFSYNLAAVQYCSTAHSSKPLSLPLLMAAKGIALTYCLVSW